MSNFRIVADHRTSNDNDVVLATSKSLELLDRRINRDARFWDEMGWEGFLLESRDEDGQWSAMLGEDLLGRVKRQEITWALHQSLRGLCL